jgi:acyl-CoA synthetase (AMP-forming)/AMP-acid ligase II
LPDYLGTVAPEDLNQFVKQSAAEGKIPKYGVPEKYVFTDGVPKTSVGKLSKKVLGKEYK